jgi:hypothetical protein
MFSSDNPNRFRIVLNNIVFVSSYSNGGYFNGCYGNKFDINCYNNTFGNNCNCNTFGIGCYGNTFGKTCGYNTFGSKCYDNTFGNNCDSNVLGNDCYENTLGNNSNYNTFGKWCYGNTFEDYCYDNTLGNYCIGNKFGYEYCSNTFGNYCESNIFETDNMYACRFGDGVSDCVISSGYTTGNVNCLQNIIVLNGTKGNYNNKLDLGVVDDVMVFEENIGGYDDIIPSLVCGYTRDKDNQILYVVKDYFIPVLI